MTYQEILDSLIIHGDGTIEMPMATFERMAATVADVPDWEGF